MPVVLPGGAPDNANKAFFRVVAIDAHGTASGPSDYAEMPHPFIYSQPVTTAQVGKAYRYQGRSLRSLGDYHCRQDPAVKQKKYAYRFWDVEENRFRLSEAPTWLQVDPETGLLTGTPGKADVGTHRVKIEVANQFDGQAEQEFSLVVTAP
jgi:hypothetical protein